MFRQDYLLRLIEQFADALRRITGLRKRGDYDAALGDIESTWNKLLDVPYQLVDVTDTATLAEQLKSPAHMRIAAQLLAEEAQALAGKGDPMHASVRYRKALELFLEARAADPQPDDEAAILELSRHVHANQLDPRYRR